MSSSGIAGRLAAFAAGPIAPDDRMRRFVNLSLLDWSSVGLAGRNEPVAQAAAELARAESGPALLLAGGHATPRAAALANGTAGHALDYDDTHFGHIGHPSVAVIPAALALVGHVRGRDFLDALTIGQETACRVGAWLGRSHYLAGFHQTGTSGAFGATAAACRILGLEHDLAAHAMCLTATRAAGLKSQFGSMGKPLNAGFAAEVGVTSALLAKAGATSMSDAIEGTQGFGPTHGGEGNDFAFDDLGKTWIFSDISYKFHACCHGLHAMLEALQDLRGAGVTPDQIAAVHVQTNPAWLVVCNQLSPVNGLQAKFSYRLTAAMVLAGRDTAALETYSDASCTDPVLSALRNLVTVTADPLLSETEARVVVETQGGARHEAHHDIRASMEMDILERRLRAKSTSLLDVATTTKLEHAILGLATSSDLSAYLKALEVGPPLASQDQA